MNICGSFFCFKFTVIENNNQTDQHSDCQLGMGGVVQGNAHILVQKFAFLLLEIGITDVVLLDESKEGENV